MNRKDLLKNDIENFDISIFNKLNQLKNSIPIETLIEKKPENENEIIK